MHPIAQALHYDPDTGIFKWKDTRRRKKATAGHIGPDGYLRIMYKYRMYSGAQLAWLLYYGEWPGTLVDHKDRNPSNNRINNLRKAGYSLNAHNSALRVDNTTGSKGMYFDHRLNKWCARIGRKYLGSFSTKEAAITARKEAERVYTHS